MKARRIIIPPDGSPPGRVCQPGRPLEDGGPHRHRHPRPHGPGEAAPGQRGLASRRGRTLSCSLPSVARADLRQVTLQSRLPMKRMAWTAMAVSLATLVLGPAHAQPGRPGGGLSPDDERIQQMMNMVQDVQEQMPTPK